MPITGGRPLTGAVGDVPVSGIASIPISANSIAVAFAEAFEFRPSVVASIERTEDSDDSVFVVDVKVTTAGFTATFSASVESDDYNLHWTASPVA